MAEENEKPKDDKNPAGGFLSGILDNFSNKDGETKWGAILGTGLFAAIGMWLGGGFSLGGIIGALIGAVGGGLLSGPLNDFGDTIGHALGFSSTPARDKDYDTKAPTQNKSTSVKVGKGETKTDIPVPDASSMPDLPADAATRSMESFNALETKSKKLTVEQVKQARQEVAENDSALNATFIVSNKYAQDVNAWEKEKGSRAALVGTLGAALRENAGQSVLGDEHYKNLDAFVPHMTAMSADLAEKQQFISKLPTIQAYNTDKMLKALDTNEFTSGLVNGLTYTTPLLNHRILSPVNDYITTVDTETLGRRAWEASHPGKSKEWDTLNPYRKANVALGELERQRDAAKPDWEKLASMTGNLSWSERFFDIDGDINSKNDIYVMEHKSPKQIVEMASRMYDQSWPSEKDRHEQIAKVMEYANASIKVEAMKQHITENVAVVATELNQFERKRMPADQKAMETFANSRLPVFNETGLVILDHGDYAANAVTSNHPGTFITYFDTKNPTLGKNHSGVVTVVDWEDNGTHYTRYIEGDKKSFSASGFLGTGIAHEYGKSVSAAELDMKKVMNLESPAKLRDLANDVIFDVTGVNPNKTEKAETPKAPNASAAPAVEDPVAKARAAAAKLSPLEGVSTDGLDAKLAVPSVPLANAIKKPAAAAPLGADNLPINTGGSSITLA